MWTKGKIDLEAVLSDELRKIKASIPKGEGKTPDWANPHELY